MIDESQLRTAMLIGDEGVSKLSSKSIAVFGAGGVGGHCIEALARCGVGRLHIVDSDVISVSNLNRQLFATKSTIGMPKIEAAKRRICDVSNCRVTASNTFVLPENVSDVIPDGIDYIIDAIDTVSAKIALVCEANKRNIPIISCMGAGNRLEMSKFRVTDIYKTEGCPLARVMRHELRKRGISKLKVVISDAQVIRPLSVENSSECRTPPPGSIAFVPAAAGLMLAQEAILDLLRA